MLVIALCSLHCRGFKMPIQWCLCTVRDLSHQHLHNIQQWRFKIIKSVLLTLVKSLMFSFVLMSTDKLYRISEDHLVCWSQQNTLYFQLQNRVRDKDQMCFIHRLWVYYRKSSPEDGSHTLELWHISQKSFPFINTYVLAFPSAGSAQIVFLRSQTLHWNVVMQIKLDFQGSGKVLQI